MDFVVEFIFQILFEFVSEVLFEVGFKRTAAVMRSRIGRYTVSALIGFGGGVWWGSHLSDLGHRPRLFWVSIAIAAIALAAAAYRRANPVMPRGRDLFAPPWRWPSWRLVGLAVFNVAIAAGIATGWTPPVVG